jgi:hypothetical protein
VQAMRAVTDLRVVIAGPAGALPELTAAHGRIRYPDGNMAR